jgi:hypothetical protein
MKTITLDIYRVDETPLLIKANAIKLDYVSNYYGTQYFKIEKPFIWEIHLITGFCNSSSGFKWVTGELQLSNKTYPVSDEQIIELKKII